MSIKRNDIRGTSPLDIKNINDNFRNLWLKLFGTYDGLETKVNSAVQTITPTAIINTINSTDGVGKVKTTNVTIDINGLDVTGGKLTVENENGVVTIDGSKKVHRVLSEGNFGIVTDNKSEAEIQNPDLMSFTITHNLGYAPVFDIYVGDYDMAFGRVPTVADFIVEAHNYTNYESFDGFTFGTYIDCTANTSTITVFIRLTPFMAHWIKTQELDRGWYFKYYIYQDTSI
jgi:hypothetical protein